MNEIRQLCLSSFCFEKHLDEIFALFHACPPHHLLPSLSLIGQSLSCMPIDRLDAQLLEHPLFLVLRQWTARLFQLWLVNGTLNDEERRALFYTHQWYKLLAEWLEQCETSLVHPDGDDNDEERQLIQCLMSNLLVDDSFLHTIARVVQQLIDNEDDTDTADKGSQVS
jgi:hypothetical protein